MATTAKAPKKKDRPTCVIYCRLSKADVLEDGTPDAEGVQRQARMCRDYAERQGWEVVEVLDADNDFTASRFARKKRKDWMRVLGLAREGAVDWVLVQDVYRLTRKPRDGEDLLDVARVSPTKFSTVNGPLDLGGPGETTFRIMVTMGAAESEATSRRMKAQRKDRATRGMPVRTDSQFGWDAEGLPIPEQAGAIRAAAEHVIAGGSAEAVARDWNSQGLPRRRSTRPWTGNQVVTVLRNPRHAGLSKYQGEVLDGVGLVAKDGSPAPTIYPPGVYEALMQVLDDPARGRGPRQRRELSGIMRCGRCGHVLRRGTIGAPRPDGSKRQGWSCPRSGGGCGGLGILAEPVEAHLFELVLTLADDGLQAPPSQTDPKVQAELDAVKKRTTELSDKYANGEVSMAAFLAADRRLGEKRKALEVRLAPARQRSTLAAYSRPGALRRAWPDLDRERRNLVMKAVLDAVTVAPADPKAKDPLSRLTVVWAQ